MRQGKPERTDLLTQITKHRNETIEGEVSKQTKQQINRPYTSWTAREIKNQQTKTQINAQAADKEKRNKLTWCYMQMEEDSPGLYPKMPWFLWRRILIVQTALVESKRQRLYIAICFHSFIYFLKRVKIFVLTYVDTFTALCIWES